MPAGGKEESVFSTLVGAPSCQIRGLSSRHRAPTSTSAFVIVAARKETNSRAREGRLCAAIGAARADGRADGRGRTDGEGADFLRLLLAVDVVTCSFLGWFVRLTDYYGILPRASPSERRRRRTRKTLAKAFYISRKFSAGGVNRRITNTL